MRVLDYGWRSEKPTRSQLMLLPYVVHQLQKAGAKRVLDAGCGNGAFARLLQDCGFIVVGVDCDTKGIEIARKHGGEFFELSLYDAPPSSLLDSFDAVVCLEVIEHLYFPARAFRFARSVLHQNGILIVSTPYQGYWKNLAISILNRWDAHWNPLRDGGHIKFFSARTLQRMAVREGFHRVSFRGVGRIPLFWKSLVLTAKKVETST